MENPIKVGDEGGAIYDTYIRESQLRNKLSEISQEIEKIEREKRGGVEEEKIIQIVSGGYRVTHLFALTNKGNVYLLTDAVSNAMEGWRKWKEVDKPNFK